MPYVGNPLANAFSSREKQDLTGQSGTSFTLTHAVSHANDLSVYINHVRQEPTTAYTVNGTALTTTGSVAGTDDFYIIYDELAVQSISHPTDQALTATSGTFTSGLVGTTGTFSGALSGTTGTFTGGITGTTGTFTGDVSLDGGNFVFNESGASKDFRVEGDTNTNLLIVDGSEDDIGIGQAPSFTSGNGVHLADDYKIGFGAGGNSRPDFQLGYSSSADRLHLACGFGSDDADFQIDTGGRLGLGAVGGGAISENIFIKDTSPTIKLEETSSGGSKRLAIAVSSSGTPFISAEQSGGLIDFFCTGAHTARVHSQGVIGQNSNSTCEFPLQSQALNTSATASHSLYLMHMTNHYDTTSMYIQASYYGSGTNYNRFIVYSNGSTYNATGTYAQISDKRLKSDITDAKSQWDDIKNIKVRNFKKYDTSDTVQIGVVSQELEKVSPNLVEEVDPSEADIKHDSTFGTLYKDGDDIPEGKEVGNIKEVKEKVKGVKYSILYMKAVKALQEAMERIETLEAKVKELESK